MITLPISGRNARIFAAVCLLALVFSESAVHAQTASVPTAKAAFLYNFAKLTEWPADTLRPGAPIVFCVIDEPGVTKALAQYTAQRSIDGHRLVVTRLDVDGPLKSCHVLYADGLDARKAAALVDRLGGAPVLSVSDFPGFTQLGGVAHLFVENGRMRFAINVDAVSRIGLRLSSKLLSLAVIVKDGVSASDR